jgi:hypothetical protein
MKVNPEFKVYMKYGRPMSSYDEEEILGTKNQLLIKKIISATIWTDVKGQRIDLNIFLESILLNGSLKHVALLSHLMSNNITINKDADNSDCT